MAGILAAALLPSTQVGFDALTALAWGGELARGDQPGVNAPLAPVFHPLPTLVGSALYPLGPDGMQEGYRLLTVLSLAALVYAAFRLARWLGGAVAGAIAIAALLTRPEIIALGQSGPVDIQFTALVLFAAALILERPLGNRWWALGLLAAAGLLRPEAWLFSLAYGAWLAGRMRGSQRFAVALVALLAPLTWASFDLIITGEPFSTAQEARGDAGDELRALGYTIPLPADGSPDRFLPGTEHAEKVLGGVVKLLGWPLAVGALVALAGALCRRLDSGQVEDPPRTATGLRRPQAGQPGEPSAPRPALLVGLAGLTILCAVMGLSILGFPFANRFILLPAVAGVLLFAVALVRLASGPWRVALVGVALAMVVTLPADLAGVNEVRSEGRETVDFLADGRDLARLPQVRAAANACPDLAAGGSPSVANGVAMLAIELERDPGEIPVSSRPGPGPDSVLLLQGGPGVGRGPAGRPSRALVAREGMWEFWSRCGGRP